MGSQSTDSASARGDAVDTQKTGHPPAIWFFFWGEFAERCSYYGMRAILPLYLTTALGFTATTGGSIYNYFKMTCYLLPLLGGYLADRYFGKYWTIVGFSVPYVLGHFVLGIPSYVALFIALALLACGSGVTKPNVSTLMGQTYDRLRPGNEQLRSAAFLWFYFSINVGSLISQFALPRIRDHYAGDHPSVEQLQYAYAKAFQFPAWLMVAALIVFALGKRFYALDTFERTVITPEQRRQQWRTLGRLLGLFALIVLFWAAYEQNDSQWTFFARDYMNLDLPFSLPRLGSHVPPDNFQFINSLFVLIFVPLFTFLFKRIDPQIKFFKATTKMLIGFALTACSCGLMSMAGFLAQSTGEKVSMLWIVAAYIVLTAGEVLLYGTGLELAYAAAPKSMKGFVTACYLLTLAAGDFINGACLSPLYGGSLIDTPDTRGPLLPGPFFLLSASIALVGTIGFYFVGRRFNRPDATGDPQAA